MTAPGTIAAAAAAGVKSAPSSLSTAWTNLLDAMNCSS
jgi:hypothetical protein